MDRKKPWMDSCMQNFYLSNRLSLSFFSNVFCLFEDDANYTSCIDRATILIGSALEVYSLNLPEYRYLFSTARIPGLRKDHMRTWKNQSHIIISILGQFYKVDIGSPLSLERLKKTLVSIAEVTRSSKPEPMVGVLTSLPRSVWGKIYNRLDQEVLDTINSAILFVAIDLHAIPQNREEKVKLISHQNAENRWYDKSHQIIVSGNGKAGINQDHTLIDGYPCISYMSDVFKKASPLYQGGPGGIYNFQKLRWKNSLPLESDIKKAFCFVQEELTKRELILFDIPQMGISDSLFQIAIQLAAYTYFGKFMSVSEAVNMRHFTQGRYDNILCVTKESKQFIEAATQTNCNVLVLHELLNQALIAHKKLIKECKSGNNSAFHLCDIVTSNLGLKQGCELGGFTDTSRSVIGILYEISSQEIQVYIKADHSYLGCAQGIKESLIQALELISRVRHLSWIEQSVAVSILTEQAEPLRRAAKPLETQALLLGHQ